MNDLYARYTSGQRLCAERDLSGHGRDYPVVKNIVEDSGKGVSGEVNGHRVRVGRFAYVTADGSGFTPVLHASGERYMSDSPESDTLGVQDGMSDDVQSTVVAPFIAPSAETSQTTPRPQVRNRKLAVRSGLRRTRWPHTWRSMANWPPASCFATCPVRMRNVPWPVCMSLVSRSCPCLPATRPRPPASSQMRSVSMTYNPSCSLKIRLPLLRTPPSPRIKTSPCPPASCGV